MFLPADTFRTVVASTPLVSIDLLVRNLQGELLPVSYTHLTLPTIYSV